jgi:hypothetical protein
MKEVQVGGLIISAVRCPISSPASSRVDDSLETQDIDTITDDYWRHGFIYLALDMTNG